MKLIALLLIISLQSFANTVTVQCDVNPGVYQSQFQAYAVLEVSADNSVKGNISYFTKADNKADMVAHPPAQVTGTLEVFPAGEMAVTQVNSYQLRQAESPVLSFSLNTGIQNSFGSRLMVDSEMGYVSGCH